MSGLAAPVCSWMVNTTTLFLMSKLMAKLISYCPFLMSKLISCCPFLMAKFISCVYLIPQTIHVSGELCRKRLRCHEALPLFHYPHWSLQCRSERMRKIFPKKLYHTTSYYFIPVCTFYTIICEVELPPYSDCNHGDVCVLSRKRRHGNTKLEIIGECCWQKCSRKWI